MLHAYLYLVQSLRIIDESHEELMRSVQKKIAVVESGPK